MIQVDIHFGRLQLSGPPACTVSNCDNSVVERLTPSYEPPIVARLTKEYGARMGIGGRQT